MVRNTNRTNDQPSRKNNSRGLASKEVQALEAAQVRKKAVISNARRSKRNVLTNDENIDPRSSLTLNRRSARLNAAGLAATPVTKSNGNERQSLNKANRKCANAPGSNAKSHPQTGQRGLSSRHMDNIEVARANDDNTTSGTPIDEDARLHGSSISKEIQDLQRQLREEKGESSS
jgi:hypothetical protein